MYTSGYGIEQDPSKDRGYALVKTAQVYMNDPKRPRVDLTVRGKVKMFAHFSSRDIILRGKAGEKIVSELVINQRPEHQFKVLNITARNGRDIKYQLETMLRTKPPVYVLTVENKKTTPGNYYDTIYLMTDSAIHPKIQVIVRGYILAPPPS